MIFDVAIGAAATLAVEFLLAHAWLWYEGGGSTTVTKAMTTVERDASTVKAKAVSFEQAVVNDVKGVTNSVKAEVGRAEQFFGQLKPGPATPAVSTSGGTPVPSVVMSTPAG